jgi:hypothetical protein
MRSESQRYRHREPAGYGYPGGGEAYPDRDRRARRLGLPGRRRG